MPRISLPNGCSSSEISVTPKDWAKASASTKEPWIIYYYFFDADGNRKPVQLRNMNHLKSLPERRALTKQIIGEIRDMLARGFNPFLERYIDDTKTMPLMEGLQFAYERLQCSSKTKNQIRLLLAYVDKAARRLGYSGKSLKEVDRKTLVFLLDEVGLLKGGWTPSTFNHSRTYMSMLFAELEQLEMVNVNFSRIRKMKEVRKTRDVLTPTQAEAVSKHLYRSNYTFWRFLNIFHQSGARVSEILRLQVKDVDLKGQRFFITVMKGRQPIQGWKTITAGVLGLWKEAVKGAKAEDYVFARGLEPGAIAINPHQITRRWYTQVKKKDIDGHKITADFYAFKHLFTTAVMDEVTRSINEATLIASIHNSHTSSAMVQKVYDTNQDRAHETLKKMKVGLGKK